MNIGKTILLVDDSDMVLALLGFKLEAEGYHVLKAADGSDALRVLDDRAIDLVITDLNMPVTNGLELIRSIRITESHRYLPVILFISDDVNDNEQISTSGATALFVKEQAKDKLHTLVKKLIR